MRLEFFWCVATLTYRTRLALYQPPKNASWKLKRILLLGISNNEQSHNVWPWPIKGAYWWVMGESCAVN
jgi:hypothetical protein